MNKYTIKVIEILERKVTINAMTAEEAVADVQELYDDEDIVLDYNDHVSTDIVPELPVSIVVTNAATGDVVVYHVDKEPSDVEAWLEEHYTRFNSDCMWMVTDKEVEHVHIY